MRQRAALTLAVLWIACAGASPLARADGFDVMLEARGIFEDAEVSFLDGGLGKLRYGEGSDAFALGRARIGYRAPIGETWHVTIDASAWADDDTSFIDLTEAYVEWRPIPSSALRSRVKIGAFYAPISLEHRGPGWTNPYSISSSALNTWVGEELRTIGVEYDLDWLGAQRESDFDFGLQAAVYAWNDPAGIILSLRSFAMHDRQTTLFGTLTTWAPAGMREDRVLFEEIDDRPGYYVGATARYAKRTELRILHYDNRGDPAQYDASIEDFAWKTSFNSIGIRYDGDSGLTLIAQALAGETYAGPDDAFGWDFHTEFLLASQEFGRQRLTARYDRFETEQDANPFPGPLSHDTGDAWTLSWSIEPRDGLEIGLEYLRIDSDYNVRLALGDPARAIEQILQVGVRYSFSIGKPGTR